MLGNQFLHLLDGIGCERVVGVDDVGQEGFNCQRLVWKAGSGATFESPLKNSQASFKETCRAPSPYRAT